MIRFVESGIQDFNQHAKRDKKRVKEKMINAIVFDLDGVIITTDELHYKAWKKMADSMGIYFDKKINDRLRGVSRMSSLDIILEKYNGVLSENEKVQIANKKNEHYRKMLSALTPLNVEVEVKETLVKLSKKGYKLAIGSSSKNAKYILKRIGLYSLFDAISDGTNITKSKPDPEVFIKAATFLDIEPKACAVVEDASDGIKAAKAAGMLAIAISNATLNQKADYCLKSFENLISVIDQIRK